MSDKAESFSIGQNRLKSTPRVLPRCLWSSAATNLWCISALIMHSWILQQIKMYNSSLWLSSIQLPKWCDQVWSNCGIIHQYIIQCSYKTHISLNKWWCSVKCDNVKPGPMHMLTDYTCACLGQHPLSLSWGKRKHEVVIHKRKMGSINLEITLISGNVWERERQIKIEIGLVAKTDTSGEPCYFSLCRSDIIHKMFPFPLMCYKELWLWWKRTLFS